MAVFAPDFYIDADAVSDALAIEGLFNMMHLESGIKVDLIVRRADEYRRVEFERRTRVNFADFQTWIVSREDLMLSKLVWARAGASDLQLGDVRALKTDTTADFAALVIERHARMSVSERFHAASAMFDVAVAIVESSLSPELSRRERRLARARRLYGDTVPSAALEAYADYAA